MDLCNSVRRKYLNHRMQRKDVNQNCCNHLYFDCSKFTYACKKQ